MKLSELTTDRAADVLCELTPFISNIVSDNDLMDELKRTVDPKTVTCRAEYIAIGLEKINKLTPIILKKRKADVFGILGVLNEKTAEEIAGQNFIVTMQQIRDVVKDRELLAFFKSCVVTEGSE